MSISDVIYIIVVMVLNYKAIAKAILMFPKQNKWLIGFATTIIFNILFFFISIIWLVMINIDGVNYPEYKVLLVYPMGIFNLITTFLAIILTPNILSSPQTKDENKNGKRI